jgi:hypothetical protein
VYPASKKPEEFKDAFFICIKRKTDKNLFDIERVNGQFFHSKNNLSKQKQLSEDQTTAEMAFQPIEQMNSDELHMSQEISTFLGVVFGVPSRFLMIILRMPLS